MKNLSIDIGSVSVSGLPAGARNREAVGRGIERALGSLLEARGLPANLNAREVRSVSLPDLRLPANATDAQIAGAVAAALDRAIAGRSGR